MSRRRSVVRDYTDALLVAVILAIFARSFIVQAFKIPTASMEANLLVGDHVLVNKFVFAPVGHRLERLALPQRSLERGDVAVFRDPEDPDRDFVKRCMGLPGDVVELRDKQLLINGRRLDESSYVVHTDPHIYPSSQFLHESYRQRDNFGPYVVPDGHYFFLGDNRDLSNDSRFWGPVPEIYIKGRVLFVYWSFDLRPDQGSAIEPSGPRSLLGGLGRLFSRTRWSRCFRLVR